jgi:hypothetical protein
LNAKRRLSREPADMGHRKMKVGIPHKSTIQVVMIVLYQFRSLPGCAWGGDQESCSRFKSSKNSRRATVPAAIAVRSDLNGPSRILAAKGLSSRKISHSHWSGAVSRLETAMRYTLLRRWSAMLGNLSVAFDRGKIQNCAVGVKSGPYRVSGAGLAEGLANIGEAGEDDEAAN